MTQFPTPQFHSALHPRDEADLADCLATCEGPLGPVGGGSKRTIGRPVVAQSLDLTALRGILDYRPEELVITVRAATPLDEVQRALAERNQRLAFEPPDLGKLLGAPRPQTIGGVLSANLAGSRRVAAGASRDHFLGFRAVSGRGERFKAGGKVVKNVTGYDLPKLLAGSWGTLAVLTEVTLRAVPAAEYERTLIVPTTSAELAVSLMSRALGSPHEVSAAAFEPEQGVTLRIEGFVPSVAARAAALIETLRLSDFAQLEADSSRQHWARIGGAESLSGCPIVWRLSVPPSEAPSVLRALAPERYLLDWGGGLIWVGFSLLEATRVRGAIHSGHATLIKANPSQRAATPVFHPLPPPLAALTQQLKAAFDPDGKLNPGRMN